MNEKKLVRALTDEELAGLAGGYVKINEAGCYDLYDEDGNYQWTFRGDQAAAQVCKGTRHQR